MTLSDTSQNANIINRDNSRHNPELHDNYDHKESNEPKRRPHEEKSAIVNDLLASPSSTSQVRLITSDMESSDDDIDIRPVKKSPRQKEENSDQRKKRIDDYNSQLTKESRQQRYRRRQHNTAGQVSESDSLESPKKKKRVSFDL